MNKIKLILVMLICAFISTLTFITAYADGTESNIVEAESVVTSDGESATESGVLTESEEIPEEKESAVESEKKPFTDEEYKEYLDNVLTESQKDLVDKITLLIAERMEIKPTLIYCIVGSVFLVGVLLFVLVGKNSVKSGEIKRLKEQNSAIAEMAQLSKTELEKVIEVLDKLSTDGFEKMLKERNGEIEQTLIESLKLDTNTIGDLLTTGAQTVAYLEKFYDFFKTMAIKKGDNALINTLAETPNATKIKEQEILIEKLKTALGEEAVKKILTEDK